MSPLTTALVALFPYLAAFAIGALIPSRQGALERFALGVVAALAVAFISGLWPGKTIADGDVLPEEWPHLLNVVVFVPILGAVAMLFMPRQMPNLLRRFTLVVMAIDFIASLGLLAVPMPKGWH